VAGVEERVTFSRPVTVSERWHFGRETRLGAGGFSTSGVSGCRSCPVPEIQVYGPVSRGQETRGVRIG
jgi:hypothetical protein